ncbi:MAG: transglycosylase domain-containing protein [Deltaproteobacteria bacterium]|nr:transglycosylase domain-containing protein [Deltaproteobacteria bacterium]
MIVRYRTISRRTLARALGWSLLGFLALRLGLHLLVVYGALVDPSRFARPLDALTLTDRHGATLRHARLGGADRRWVPLREVSPAFVTAVLTVEDRRFHAHDGVDSLALARALTYNLLPGRRRSGASTITQQLVKRVYGRPHGLASKLLEVLRAQALERVFTKDEILEQYVNRLPFGNGLEGVARASEAYFGHGPEALTVSEAALLAGIPQAPRATEPRHHLARALARRNFILAHLRDRGAIDRATYEASVREVPVLHGESPHPYEAPRFTDEALAAWRQGRLGTSRGSVRTSLDLGLQHQAEGALRAAVARHFARGARNAAAVVVHNGTGELLAYVGAAVEGQGASLDLLRARRQPGSTLKPFVYERFFELGGTGATVLDDLQRPMYGARGSTFEARDYDGVERGPVRARQALASSLNLAALDAARRVGAEGVVSRLRSLGFSLGGDASRYGAAVVLGGADVTPLELARAYVTLARGGSAVPLSLRLEPVVSARPVLDPAASALTVDILRDALARREAFGRDLVDAGPAVPFGLKTGTSQGWRDAWTAVFTDRFTVVVWLGDPGGAPMRAVSGFEGAAPAAVRILAAAERLDLPSSRSAGAEPLHQAEVCAATGLLAGHGCSHRVTERFVRGTIPRAMCAAHAPDGRVLLPARYASWASRAHRTDVVLSPRGLGTGGLRVEEPRDGACLAVTDPTHPPVVALRASEAREPAEVQWEVDGRSLPTGAWAATPGEHRLVAVLGEARSPAITVRVVPVGGLCGGGPRG